MVEIRTPSRAPVARAAGQVSTADAATLRQLGGSMQGVADQYSAYYEQKAADNAELIWAQSQADWSRKFSESAPKAGEGYASATLKDYDAYVEGVLPDVPTRQQENMQHMFAQYRINLEAKALDAEAAGRARRRAEAKAEAARLRDLAIIEDPTYGNFATLTMGLKDEETRRTFNVMAESILTSGDRDAIEDFQFMLEENDLFDEFITPDAKLNVMGNIDRMQSAFAREDAAEIDQTISDIAANAANSGEIRAEHMNLAVEEIEFSALTDAEKAEAKAALRDAADTGKALYDIRNVPIGESAANLREMRGNAETEAEWGRVNAYAQAQAQHVKAYQADRAGYTQSIGYGASAEFAAMQEAETPQERADAAKAYVQHMDDQYYKMGVPDAQRTYLPKSTAENMALSFNDSTTGLTGPQMQAYLDTWGEKAPIIQQELMAAGLDDTVAAQMWRAYDPVLGQMLAQTKGSDLREVKAQFTAETTGAYNDLEAEVYKYAEDYFAGFTAGRGADAQDFVRDMSRVAIDTIMVHEANGGSMDRTQILDRFFTEETVVSDRAAMIVPEDQDAARIIRQTDWLLSLRSRELADKIDPSIVAQMTGVDDAKVDREVMASVLRSNGMFVLNSTGDGVRLGYNMGGQFIPFNVEYTFDELNKISTKDLTFTLDQEPVGGTVMDPQVGPGDAVVAPEGSVVLRSQSPELEYSSEDPYFQEDLDAGNFRPGQAVMLDGKVIIPVPRK